MSTEKELRDRVAFLEKQACELHHASQRRGVRKRSARSWWGLPLYDIALGPDPPKGDIRGHARGVIAVGDIATGILAVGGIARGAVAVGGVALGGIAIGGCSIGIVLGIGGLATGAIALGGLAIGPIALGGGALGYYSCGGAAFGKHVISGIQQDPEAIRFFSQWLPGLEKMFEPPNH